MSDPFLASIPSSMLEDTEQRDFIEYLVRVISSNQGKVAELEEKITELEAAINAGN